MDPTLLNENENENFISYCTDGYLQKVKEICHTKTIHSSIIVEGFTNASMSNNLLICKWLTENYNITCDYLGSSLVACFGWAAIYGNEDLFKWLFYRFGFPDKKYYLNEEKRQDLFLTLVRDKNHNIIKFMFEVGDFCKNDIIEIKGIQEEEKEKLLKFYDETFPLGSFTKKVKM